MKKILLVLGIILVIPLITVDKINNKSYYLETETDTYTKEEIDSKINELLTKINDNTTKITEAKNILTEIKNKLDDYALKTALTKTNEDITTLDELVKSNKARIDELENIKNTLKQILNDKGVTTEDSDTLETLVSKVNEISSGKKMTYIGRKTFSSTNITASPIDLTSYSKYKDITVDDIYVVPYRIQLGHSSTYTFSLGDTQGIGITISKSYDESTGILTLSAVGTSVWGNNLGWGYVNVNWQSMFDIYVLE